MKQSITLWQLLGFGITALGGTLLHFLYELLNESTWVAPFSAVNESTWEHMKLLFWPMFIFAIIECLFYSDRKNFWCVKLMGISIGLTTIPVIFYTYNGAIGKSPDWFNISIFFISAATSFIIETKLYTNNKMKCCNNKLSFAILFVLGILFIIFTFYTPKLPIFKDPLTSMFGIN